MLIQLIFSFLENITNECQSVGQTVKYSDMNLIDLDSSNNHKNDGDKIGVFIHPRMSTDYDFSFKHGICTNHHSTSSEAA